MQEGNLSYRNSTIHYKFTKSGSKLLVCWHGYDESSASFAFLQNELQDFSLLCIDLPHHGDTHWGELSPVTDDDLVEIVTAIRKKEFATVNSFSILGFSLGGRLALSFFQSGTDTIDKVILLAPDGIHTNFWHWFSTRTVVGNKIFKFSVSHPGWIFFLLKVGNRLRLINQSVYKFTRFYLQDRSSRELLYRRWTCMRKISPDRVLIKEAAKKHGVIIDLVYGEYDRIIRHEKAAEFCKDLHSNCRLHVLSCGHQVLSEKNAAFIANLLRN